AGSAPTMHCCDAATAEKPHRLRPELAACRLKSLFLRATLTQTGWAGAADKKSLFQLRYQRVKLRRGGQRAVLAIAHAQLIAIYWALRNGTPYPEQVQRMEQERRDAQIRYE